MECFTGIIFMIIKKRILIWATKKNKQNWISEEETIKSRHVS